MKNKYFLLTAGIFLIAFVLSGCNEKSEAEKLKENIQSDLEKAQADFENDLAEFKNDTELRIQTNQTKIDSFKIKMKKAGNKIKHEYEKRVELLEENNKSLRKNLVEYKYDGKENWNEFKFKLNNELDEIGKSIDDYFENL